MPKRQISIMIDPDLLDVIDSISRHTRISRSELIEHFIRRAIREYTEYSDKLEKQTKKIYDIVDRIVDEALRNTLRRTNGK